mgnify:CR=1 FL=1
MIMDIPRVGHGQIPSLQKLPMAEMPLEAYKGGYYRLLCKHDLIADQRTGVDVYGTNHADLASVVREGQRQGIDKGQFGETPCQLQRIRILPFGISVYRLGGVLILMMRVVAGHAGFALEPLPDAEWCVCRAHRSSCNQYNRRERPAKAS